MTTVHEGYNICDPNDWKHEIGACDCGEGDCNDCQPRTPQNPSWSTPDYEKNGEKIDGDANAWVDDRHLRDNHYNEI